MRVEHAAAVMQAATSMLGEPALLREATPCTGQRGPRTAAVNVIGERGWDQVDSESGFPLRVEDQVVAMNPCDVPWLFPDATSDCPQPCTQPVRSLKGLLLDYRGCSWRVVDSRTDSQLGLLLRLQKQC